MALVTFAVVLNACAVEPTASPATPVTGATALTPYASMAFAVDVNVRAATVSIAAPAAAASPVSRHIATTKHAELNASLLAGDAVRLELSGFRASRVGEFAPGKVRVTLEATLVSRLPGLGFAAPTWPTPPAPYVTLFPLDYAVTRAPGGVTGGDGNTIAVNAPGVGRVEPSPEWNGTGEAGSGSAYAFFRSSDCSLAASRDCFRWVAFGVAGLPSPRTRTIGFDVDASVAQFRARMIVAADLVPVASAPAQVRRVLPPASPRAPLVPSSASPDPRVSPS